jgi:hypothetical protein
MVDDTGPDLSIYSQWDPNVPDPKMWDNPDIRLFTGITSGVPFTGNFIESYLLSPGTYGVEVTLQNKGCSKADNIKVSLEWYDWNAAGLHTPHTTGIQAIINPFNSNTCQIDLDGGEEGKVWFEWTTQAAQPSKHYCLLVRIDHPNDPLPPGWDRNTPTPTNQVGQENTNVGGVKKTGEEILIPVGNPLDRLLHPQIEIIQHIKPGEANWSFVEVYIPDELPPYGTDTVVFNVSPPPDTHGESREFSINLRDEHSFLLGGVMIKVVSDTPPTLEWVGTPGYTDDGIEPDSGEANTRFTYKVKYTDEDNDPPKVGMPLLYILKGDKQIEGSPFVMNEEDATDTHYTDGKIYTYSIALSEAGDDYTYYFWARDGLEVEAEGPATNVMSGPLVKMTPGVTWSDPIRITTDPNKDDHPSIIEFSPHGLLPQLWISWHSFRTSPGPDLFYKISSAPEDEASWLGVVPPQLTTSGGNYRPASARVEIGSSRQLWVVWGTGGGIYYKYYYQ